MSVIESSDFTLSGSPQDGGLDITLTRYRRVSPDHGGRGLGGGGERLSLLFIHGVSYHKETWIPTIECLFELQSAASNDKFSVVEAWAMDAPNHGCAAVLNDVRLLSHPGGLGAHEIGRAVQVFLESGFFEENALVGVGHSASVPVMSLSTLGYSTLALPYSAMIFVDPPIMTREVFEKMTKDGHGHAWDILVGMAKTRKDIWPSREAAREWMAKRLPWKSWTPRCLDLFVEHALRDLPTAVYPDHKDGVTLCCTRDQEVGGYTHHHDGFDSLDRLKDICAAIPVHCIFAERDDVVPRLVKETFVDVKQGRKMASITTVPNSGHLVVQEDPKGLALAIWGVLCQDGWNKKDLSRL